MSSTSGSANTWKSQAGFVWSLIGSAVGFANILSFSAKAYKNGGGAYLIPYTLALFLIGIPFLILEGKIGHRWKAPLVTSFGIVWGRIGKIFGWISVFACLTIGAFYIVLTGYSAAYMIFSATGQIPEDTQTFFLQTFLQVTSGGVRELGSFSPRIFFSTACIGLLSWFVLRQSMRKGIERICSFFMPMLVILIVISALLVSFLPGGLNGWIYYLTPDFSKLLSAGLWCDVFGQLFFSLSLGLGIIIGYARHTDGEMNIRRAMTYVALGDFFVSFIAGAAIFGCLAHISYTQGIPFDQILTSDSTFEIGFILFPKIFQFFTPWLTQAIGTLFFFCVFIAGITGVFSIVESVAGNVEIEFRLQRKKAVATALTLILFFSSFFCMGNGAHLIDALAPMLLGTNMLLGGLTLLFAFGLGKRSLLSDTSRGFRFCLQSLVPLILGTIFISNLWQEQLFFDLPKAIRWSWLSGAFLLATAFALSQKQQTLFLRKGHTQKI